MPRCSWRHSARLLSRCCLNFPPDEVFPPYRDIPYLPPGVVQSINYGIDYLRFIHPVRVEERIRLRMTLTQLESRGEGLLIKASNVVDIEGVERAALVVETLTLLRF